MDIAQSKFMAKVEELFNNRDNADVTLYCEGESIMAHSSILEMRWDTGICSLRVQTGIHFRKYGMSKLVALKTNSFSRLYKTTDAPL